ncbi:MAG: T9SS type A sorting domain-containing protein [Bacteroidales bacterium]
MRKLLLIMIGMFVSFGVFAQTLTDWTNANPGNITLTQETSNVNEGTSALGVISTTQSQGDTEVLSATFTVTPDATFAASVDVYDNDIAGRARLNVEFDDGTTEWGPYSSDGTDFETIELTGDVPTDATTATVFFRFYDYADDWDGDFECILDNVIFTEDGGDNLVPNGGFENWETLTPTEYLISEIQDTTGNGGGNGSAVEGEYVETNGIVTAVYDGEYVIQDGTGMWSGVWVAGSGVDQGDDVTVTGNVSEDNNLTTILADDVTVNSSENTLPAAEVLATGDCPQEGWEGVLLETTGTCTNDTVEDNFGEFPLDDGSGEVLVDDYGLASMYYPTQGNDYTVTSPLMFSYGAFKIAVRTEADIVEDVGTEPYLAITSPADGSTVNSADVEIEFDVQNFVLGDGTGDGYLAYSVDGGVDEAHYTTDPISLTGLTEETHTVDMELLDGAGDPLSPAVTASVSFTVDLSTGPELISIYDIQYTEEASGDSPYDGQEVATAGIVTAVNDDKFWLQDGTGAWNGIYVYYIDTPGPARGDSVIVYGTVVEYNNLTEISPVDSIDIVSNGNTLPAPAEVTTGEAGTEAYEGVLVQVEGVNNNAPDEYNEWDVNDGSGEVMVDDLLYTFEPTIGNSYNVTGVVEYYFNFKILPRDENDIIDLGVSTDPNIAITSPTNGDVIYTDAVDIEFNVSNFTVGTDGKVAYSLDDAAYTYQETADPITFTDLTEGSHSVSLELVDMSENPLSPEVTATVNFEVDFSGPAITPIYDIQYTSSGDSPLLDDEVTIKGVVVANFNSSDYGTGYYVQDGAGAWNGLYIYDETNSPSMEDSVQITGTVSEFYGMTQLEDITDFQIVDIGGTISGPEVISIADANTEDYESCFIRVENVSCVEEQNQYGEWKVAIGNDTLLMKDNGAFDFTEELNQEYHVQGVTNYSYGEYSLHYRVDGDIEIADAIGEEFASDLRMYPNPASDVLTVENAEEVEQIKVYSVTGKLMDAYNVNGNTFRLNLADYSQGIYLVKFVSGSSSRTARIEKM